MIAGTATGPGRATEAVRQMMARVESSHSGSEACEHCEERLTWTRYFCADCKQRLCETCSGGGEHRACPLVRCTKCRVKELQEDDYLRTLEQGMQRLALAQDVQELEKSEARAGTYKIMRRGLAVLEEYGALFRTRTLPLTPTQAVHFAVWCVLHRESPLDTATVQLYATSAISRWHEQAKEATGLPLVNPTKTRIFRTAVKTLSKLHKKPSKAKAAFTAKQLYEVLHRGFDLDCVGGRHDRLLTTFLAAGPFRAGLACSLVVKYHIVMEGRQRKVQFLPGSEVYISQEPEEAIVVEVNLDKNVTALSRRLAHIPPIFFGLRVLQELLDYLLIFQPPSGGTLFAAPKYYPKLISKVDDKGAVFNAGAYTAASAMVKRAVVRAYPQHKGNLAFVDSFGGGTPRKSSVQCLWSIGTARRVIIDHGGWSHGKEDAVDMYFHTQPHQRLVLLKALLPELKRCGELPVDTPEEEPEDRVLGRAIAVVQQRVWTPARRERAPAPISDSDSEDEGEQCRVRWVETRLPRNNGAGTSGRQRALGERALGSSMRSAVPDFGGWAKRG